MSEALIPLDPNSEQAKHAVMALLGATLAELKQIDQCVVGSSSNIKGMKTDLKNVFNTLTHPSPQPVATQQQVVSYTPAPVATVVNAGLNIEPVKAVIQPPPAPEVQDDPNQLVFDFNKPITPDTINNKLDTILDRLSTIIDLLKT
jgi:hypothetical protein